MTKISVPPFLSSSWTDSFNLKEHLQGFLHLDAETLDFKLESGGQQMAKLGYKDFDWEQATGFYRDKVGELYLFDLGAWHIASFDYIENTLLLLVDHAKGRVLDFGGGIGTHAICAALCPQVEQVIFCDINQIHHDFVRYRAEKLGLNNKIIFCYDIPPDETFDTIISFDVLEHLPDPGKQLIEFHQALTDEGKTILNWNFSKGPNQEHPFHIDDPQVIESFFKIIQSKFLEIFHTHNITARCYRKWS